MIEFWLGGHRQVTNLPARTRKGERRDTDGAREPVQSAFLSGHSLVRTRVGPANLCRNVSELFYLFFFFVFCWSNLYNLRRAAEWDNADTKETISQSFAKAEGQDSVTVTRNEGDSEIVEGSALTSGDQLALLQQRLVIQLQLDNVETSNGGEQVFEAPDDDSESNTGQTRQVLSREDRIRLRKQQLEEDEKRETAIDDARQLLLELRNVLSKRP